MKEVHTLYKLIFLYLLDRVEFPLTNGQICAFVAEEQYTDYFTVQETLADMVESKLLETELVRNSTFYSLTDSGKETLSYFKDDISTAIQKDIENYLKKNKMKLRNENAVLADYSNLDEGGFSVKLQIKEKRIVLNIEEIKFKFIIWCRIIFAIYLCITGQSRFDLQPVIELRDFFQILSGNLRPFRSWSNQRHISFENVEDLWQLIKMNLA